jgi:transposase InsO family protein
MSRLGNPFDNAKAESFMKTLEARVVDGKAFVDLSDARCRISASSGRAESKMWDVAL